MQAAACGTATRQRHVERLGSELGFELGIAQRLTTCFERGLDGILGLIDGGTRSLALLGGQFAQALEQFGHRTGFAQVDRLALFELGAIARSGKIGARRLHDLIKLFHVCSIHTRAHVRLPVLAPGGTGIRSGEVGDEKKGGQASLF